MVSVSQLASNIVFSSIPLIDLNNIGELAISRRYLKGEFVTYQEDVWPYLLFVQSGEFQALKESGSGRSFVIKNFGPGEIFWGLALFEEHKLNPAAIRTSAEGELLLWHKTQIQTIISQNTQVAWGLFHLLAEKMGQVSKIVEGLVFQPLSGRLANLLMNQFEHAVDNSIARDMTLDQMAARLGTTREMVCKILYQFSDQGGIDIYRTELVVNDWAKLSEIANTIKG
ncbi:Crp/Fnr family transcriptional regulator [Chloroflexota bacterium]